MEAYFSLPGVDSNNATDVAIYYQTHAIPQRFNAGIVVASIFVSILGSYASLYLLGKRTSNSGIRNIAILISAAATMAFVGIWSMHFIGMYMRLEATPQMNWYIRYNPGFAVFSFVAPAITLIVSFLFLDHDTDGFRFWKAILAGTLTGCIVSLMHYSASFYCNFNVTFDTGHVVGSILLACVLCIVGLTAFFRFRSQWQDSWWKMGACAIILGAGVSGMHYTGVSGTSYQVKPGAWNMPNLNSGKRRNLILVCVIAVLCFVILLGIAVAALAEFLLKQTYRKKARKLVVASATFDKSGRLMVNGDGTLPLITVEERTLRRSQVLQALDQRSSTFQWLYAISWNWNLILPFIDVIAGRALDQETRQNSSKGGVLSRTQKARKVFAKRQSFEEQLSGLSQTSLLDFRDKIVDAAQRLAKDLDVPLTELGIFYDNVLPTGTKKEVAKLPVSNSFRDSLQSRSLSGSSSAPPTFDDELRIGSRPASIFGKGDDEAEGVTIFVVREVSQESVNQFAKRGYRFTQTRFLSNILADRHAVVKQEMESTLESLRLYAKRGTKPIVQAGGYYAGLFCVRPNHMHETGSLDVLVYDFARHQIPAFRLSGVSEISEEITSFLRSVDQYSIEKVMMACQVGSRQVGEEQKRINKLLERHIGIDDEVELCLEMAALEAVVQFQQSLYNALKAMQQSVTFIPNFVSTAKLSTKTVELPSSLVDSTSPPAHLLLVQTILSTDKITRRVHVGEPSSPLLFTPYTLFAKTQMMMLKGTPADEFAREVSRELNQRYMEGGLGEKLSRGYSSRQDGNKSHDAQWDECISSQDLSSNDKNQPSLAKQYLASIRARSQPESPSESKKDVDYQQDLSLHILEEESLSVEMDSLTMGDKFKSSSVLGMTRSNSGASLVDANDVDRYRKSTIDLDHFIPSRTKDSLSPTLSAAQPKRNTVQRQYSSSSALSSPTLPTIVLTSDNGEEVSTPHARLQATTAQPHQSNGKLASWRN